MGAKLSKVVKLICKSLFFFTLAPLFESLFGGPVFLEVIYEIHQSNDESRKMTWLHEVIRQESQSVVERALKFLSVLLDGFLLILLINPSHPLKAFIKPFEAPQRSVKIKI